MRKKHIWTEKEEAYLIDNYKNSTHKKISEEISIPVSSIRHRLKKLGIKKLQGFFRDGGDKYQVESNYFKVLNEKSCYILGFITADGHIDTNNRHRVTIGINKKDFDILDFIRSEISPDAKIYGPNKLDSVVLNLSGKTLINDLADLGLDCKKEGIKNIFNKIPNKYHGDFIRGFFDGDGSMSWKVRTRGKYSNVEGKVNFCNIDLDFLKELQRIFSFCSIINQSSYYYLQTSSLKNIKKIYDTMYYSDLFCLTRKKEKFIKFFEARGIL